MAKANKINKKTIKRLIERIKGIIDEHTYLRLNDDGHYYGEIYADYRDEFDDSMIQKIFNDDNPRDMFYSLLDFSDCEWDFRDELINTIKEHFNDDYKTLSYSKHEDFIRDWVNENVYYNHPYDHFLKQDVYVDILVDAGDGNYDYTMNELFGCKYSEKGLSGKDKSALVWLMRQQGYSMESITDFVENENMQGSKLFRSIYQECLNTSSCMNALTFFVKLSLSEALDLDELINNTGFKENGYEKSFEGTDAETGEIREIILDKGTACGLYDAWNGSGSMLEIELEKDVVLPVKYIDNAKPDGCRGYSVSGIYGMLRSFWTHGGLTINKPESAAA